MAMKSVSLTTKIILDTKGLCFLCLNEREAEEEGLSPPMFSYQSLLRFLKMDRNKIFGLNVSVETLKVLDKAELHVPLCSKCSLVAQRFQKLYEELDKLRLSLNLCVQNIYDEMNKSENDAEVLKNYWTKMNLHGKGGKLHSNLISNLRRETMEKCKRKIETSSPQVALEPLRLTPWIDISHKKKKISKRKPIPIKAKRVYRKCDYCSATFESSRYLAHLYYYHAPEHFKEYRGISVSQEVFTMASTLAFQNISMVDNELSCPYCPKKIKKMRGLGVRIMAKHVGVNHEEEVVARLKMLQTLDLPTLLKEHGGDKCRSCAACGQLLPTYVAWVYHVQLLCEKAKAMGLNSACPIKIKLDPPPAPVSYQDQAPAPVSSSNVKKIFRVDSDNQETIYFDISNIQWNDYFACVEKAKRSGNKIRYIQCPHCLARPNFRTFISHILIYHSDKCLLESKLSSCSPDKFKLCSALLFGNVKLENNRPRSFICPYCPNVRKLGGVSSIYGHLVAKHKNQFIDRLNHLQSLSMDALMTTEGGNMLISCKQCGDLFPNHLILGRHTKYLCLTLYETSSSPDSSRKRSNQEEEDDEDEDIPSEKKPRSTPPESEQSTSIKITNAISMAPTPIPKRRMKCSICGEDFSDSISLRTHKSTHTTASIQNMKFPCPHCPQVSKFYFTFRAHLIKCHPVQMFQKRMPPDTGDQQIEKHFQNVLLLLTRENGTENRCNLCGKDYGQHLELENHVLVTHFDTVVMKLRKLIMREKDDKKSEASEGIKVKQELTFEVQQEEL